MSHQPEKGISTEQLVREGEPGATGQKLMAPGKNALLHTSLILCPDHLDLDKPAKLSAETGGATFGATVSNLDTNELAIEPHFRVNKWGAAATGAEIDVRITDADGLCLGTAHVDYDLADNPRVCTRPFYAPTSPFTVKTEGIAASMELNATVWGVRSLWSGRGIAAYLLDEKREDQLNRLSLLLEGFFTLESMTLETSVCDASGIVISAPQILVVDPKDEPLTINGTAIVAVDLPWSKTAAEWSVVGGEVHRTCDSRPVFETVEFGSYPTTAAGDPMPIEWLVLAQEENRQLLLAKNVLDALPYNDSYGDKVDWATCTLRSWLNGEFLETAFTDEERDRIALVLNNNDNDSCPGCLTCNGEATEDHVFCLSLTEACGYFNVETVARLRSNYDKALNAINPYDIMPGFESLVAYATDYAIERGVNESLEESRRDKTDNRSCWRLRSPAFRYHIGNASNDSTAYVAPDGEVITSQPLVMGYDVISSACGIRPALWLNL